MYLDGTLSLSVYVVVVYDVIIDDVWSRTKRHALHVVLCREAARRCVCGHGVKVKGPWRQRVAARLQVVMMVPQPCGLRQLKG